MASGTGPTLEQLLQMGITAAKEGNKDGARQLLKQVVKKDSSNDRAWLWLAKVAEGNQQRRQYLDKALKANPNNKAAKQALEQISATRSSNEQHTLMMGLLVVLGVSVIAALVIMIVLLAS